MSAEEAYGGAVRKRDQALCMLAATIRERDDARARVGDLEGVLRDVLEAHHEGHEEIDGLIRRAGALLAPSEEPPHGG